MSRGSAHPRAVGAMWNGAVSDSTQHLTPAMGAAHVKARADSTILGIYNSNLLGVSVTSLPLQCGFFLLIDQQMLKLQYQVIQTEQLYLLY